MVVYHVGAVVSRQNHKNEAADSVNNFLELCRISNLFQDYYYVQATSGRAF